MGNGKNIKGTRRGQRPTAAACKGGADLHVDRAGLDPSNGTVER